MDAAKACMETVRDCRQQLQDNAKVFLTRDPDSNHLHKMRVALRRMRSTFGISPHAFDETAFSDISTELKWLLEELGPARNWDVFVLKILPPILAALSQEHDFAKLQQSSDVLRGENRDRAITAIESHRFQALLLELKAALAHDSWLQGNASSIGHFANLVLEKCYHNFRKRGRSITTLHPEQLHTLRINGKKLRYASEFFLPLYPARSAHSFLTALSGLQDTLGAINDAVTANHLFKELPDVDLATSCLVKGWLACETRQLTGQLDLQWKQFNTIAPFW